MFALPAGWKPFSVGALVGAVVITWTGFDALGWKTANASQSLGKRQADAAVVTALASICEARFKRQADFAGRLASLEKMERYSRGESLRKGGWATMPGGGELDQDVSRACAELLFPENKS